LQRRIGATKKGVPGVLALRTGIHSSGDGVTLKVEELETYSEFDFGEDDRRPRHIHMQACMANSLWHNLDMIGKDYSHRVYSRQRL